MPADFHEGSYRDFLRRHERESADAARRTGRQRTEFAGCLFRRAADSRNLRCSIDYLAAEGGSAPGPNGLTLDELDGSERWELARALGEAIRTGRYRPGPHREVRIPKGPGRGMRTLRIRNVEDRVVERAIVQVVQPFLDPTFAPASFGYRPGAGQGARAGPRRGDGRHDRLRGSGCSMTSRTPSTTSRWGGCSMSSASGSSPKTSSS